jgi:hypothetical protein
LITEVYCAYLVVIKRNLLEVTIDDGGTSELRSGMLNLSNCAHKEEVLITCNYITKIGRQRTFTHYNKFRKMWKF